MDEENIVQLNEENKDELVLCVKRGSGDNIDNYIMKPGEIAFDKTNCFLKINNKDTNMKFSEVPLLRAESASDLTVSQLEDGTNYLTIGSEGAKFNGHLLPTVENYEGYWALKTPTGEVPAYLRTGTYGLIPYSADGGGAIGTSGWRFSSGYINDIYGNLHGNASTASTADTASKAMSVYGDYTGNGGFQGPSYIGTHNVRFNMMDRFEGLHYFDGYADVMMMNAYSWSDVPYATALAIQKNGGVPRAWIASGGNSSVWGGSAELITSANIGSQSVNYATGAGNADNLDGYNSSAFAFVGNPNNLMHSGNEFTYASPGFSGGIWHNYRTSDWNTNGNITAYYFGNGATSYSNVTLYAGYFSGRSGDSVRVYRQQVRTGAYYIPNYTCNTAAGTNYYGDVSVSISFGDSMYGYLPSRPNTVILQVLDGTTGVIQIEPVSWDHTGIWTIRIHRANAQTNVSGFYITWLAMA